MKTAIMQPYLLPYIGYFQLIDAVDQFIIYDDVNYINRGYVNRNNILVNGQKYLFTIPLINASQNKLINEIEVNGNKKWAEKILKTIELSYKRAPYFNVVWPMAQDIFNNNDSNLSQYITNSIVLICKYLDIETQIIPSSSIYQNTSLKAEQRILDICKKTNTTQYINPIGGTELYNKENFEKALITLNFIKTKKIEYGQISPNFVENLSILDVLMHNDKLKIKNLLSQFELI